MSAGMVSQVNVEMLGQLLRASLEAAVFALLVWLVCRLAPRLPAGARSFLWWAACLKLLVGLLWVTPLRLPLLPAGFDRSSRTMDLASRDVGPLLGAGAAVGRGAPEGELFASARQRPSQADADPARSEPQARAHRPESSRLAPVPRRSPRPTAAGGQRFGPGLLGFLANVLVGIWLLGALTSLAVLLSQLLRARRMLQRSVPVTSSALLGRLSSLTRQLGLRRPPSLCSSDEIETPQAAGLLRPVVVLPAADLDRFSGAELDMVLCHELVHLRRRDLWLGWVPALAERLFFFHPLAALAAREYALAREAACDAEVLRVLGSAPRDYGRLLLRLGTTRRPARAFVLGAAPASATLKRRLEMLQDSAAPRRRSPWPSLLALAAVAALPSFRLVALARAAAMPGMLAASPSAAAPVAPTPAVPSAGRGARLGSATTSARLAPAGSAARSSISPAAKSEAHLFELPAPPPPPTPPESPARGGVDLSGRRRNIGRSHLEPGRLRRLSPEALAPFDRSTTK